MPEGALVALRTGDFGGALVEAFEGALADALGGVLADAFGSALVDAFGGILGALFGILTARANIIPLSSLLSIRG